MPKAQVATEYLVIVALGIAILIPTLVYLNDLYIDYKDQAKLSTAKTTVNKLASLTNWVYSQGEPSMATINIIIPESVDSIIIQNKTISFRIKTRTGLVEISENVLGNVTGSLPTLAGYYKITIQAQNNIVNISVV